MPVSIDGYLIDASETESHSFDSDVTEDETESGVAFTDNIKPKAPVIEIVGVVSDTPIADMVRVREAATSTGVDSELPFLPSDEAQAKLLDIWRKPRPVIVQTTRGTFENMAMTALSLPVSGESGDALRFTASFKQIRIVTTERVVVRVAAPQLGGKSKIARPPVVVIGVPRNNVLTKTGKEAEWNPDKGRYEYPNFQPGTATGRGPGTPVPNSDLAGVDVTNLGKNAPVEENTTFFDNETDEWKNTDGTPVTRDQINKHVVPGTQTADSVPEDAQPFYSAGA